MKTGAGLVLIAIGAIFAFAVKGSPGFVNLHTVGWVLMLVGLVGLLLLRSTYGWLGRRMTVRRGYPGGQVVQQRTVPSYVGLNPGTAREEAGLPPEPSLLDQDDLIDGTRLNGEPYGSPRPATGDTEVVEDLYEQP